MQPQAWPQRQFTAIRPSCWYSCTACWAGRVAAAAGWPARAPEGVQGEQVITMENQRYGSARRAHAIHILLPPRPSLACSVTQQKVWRATSRNPSTPFLSAKHCCVLHGRIGERSKGASRWAASPRHTIGRVVQTALANQLYARMFPGPSPHLFRKVFLLDCTSSSREP